MVRDIVETRILERIKNHPKIIAKGMGLPSIRNAISQIHKKNHGITMNAAAHEFSTRNGFSVYKSLHNDDKLSLQHLKSPTDTKSGSTGKKSKIKTKDLVLPYGKKFIREANENAGIYPYVYVLENSLRSLILEKLKGEKDWWNNKKFVKDEIRDYAKKIQEAEKNHKWLGKGRGDHPIYYIGLEHLLKIIEKNFNPYFKGIFDLGHLRTWINESIPIRNLVAHNIRTQKEERENIKIRTKYICNLIEKNMIT